MGSVKPVVVGVDFSSASRAALLRGARFAAAIGAPLRVVHVVDGNLIGSLAESWNDAPERVSAEATTYAQGRLKDFVAHAAVPTGTSTNIRTGSLGEEIVAEAEAVDARLLVLGTHGAAGPAPGAGSLASYGLRHVACDVALVQDGSAAKLAHVVAGVDFAATCERVVSAAAEIANADGARLHLVHVYNPPWKQLHWRAPTPESTPEFRAQFLDALRARLQQAAKNYAHGAPASVELVENDSHGRGLVEFVRKSGADLLVIGKHGRRSRISELVLGSTAERLLRETPTSLYAVAGPRGR